MSSGGSNFPLVQHGTSWSMGQSPSPFAQVKGTKTWKCPVGERCPPIKVIDGLITVPTYVYDENNLRNAINLKPQPYDVFVVGYPRTGATWVQYIVWAIVTQGQRPLPEIHEMYEKEAPYLEIAGTAPLKNLPAPRIIKTHMSYGVIPYTRVAKYIYVARNPKDVAVSYFLTHKNVTEYCYDGNFSHFFEHFTTGTIGFGSYWEHLRSWHEVSDYRNVYIITYEELYNNTDELISNLAKFLGYGKFIEDSSNLRRIVNMVSLKCMKQLTCYLKVPNLFTADDRQYFQLINKGGLGEWEHYFSQEQSDFVDEENQWKLARMDCYMKFWKPINNMYEAPVYIEDYAEYIKSKESRATTPSSDGDQSSSSSQDRSISPLLED